jgi:hypothetical protein
VCGSIVVLLKRAEATTLDAPFRNLLVHCKRAFSFRNNFSGANSYVVSHTIYVDCPVCDKILKERHQVDMHMILLLNKYKLYWPFWLV